MFQNVRFNSDMSGRERDEAEHRAALERFGGKMPDGSACKPISIYQRQLSSLLSARNVFRRGRHKRASDAWGRDRATENDDLK